MFVIQKNNNVVYGPAEYNASMFKYILVEDCELEEGTFSVPFKLNEKLQITEEISILPAKLIYENINSKIHQFAGPFWEISEDEAVGTFKKADKDINSVKNELKQIVASNRYNLEVKDLKLTIQEQQIIVDGSRENKNLFYLNYSIIGDTEKINWKFPKSNSFLNLDKSDLGLIVAELKKQVQLSFDLELAKIEEIDSKETLEDLDLVDLNIKFPEGTEA